MHLIKLESVDSTNLYAQHLITDWLAKDKTIVLALEQTSGKGQRGNTWDSTLNKGLYTSFIFFPEKMLAHEQFLFNKALSVGIAEYISKTIGVKAEIKWPNDILIQGCKISGTLIQNQLRGNKVFAIVAGVGVNLNQDVFPDNFETPATSMHLITEKLYNPQVEVEMLFGFVNRYYDLLQNGEHEKVRIAYNSYLFRKGEPSRFRDIDGYFEAVLEDVDDEGAAILIRNGRPVRALHPFVRFSLV